MPCALKALFIESEDVCMLKQMGQVSILHSLTCPLSEVLVPDNDNDDVSDAGEGHKAALECGTLVSVRTGTSWLDTTVKDVHTNGAVLFPGGASIFLISFIFVPVKWM